MTPKELIILADTLHFLFEFIYHEYLLINFGLKKQMLSPACRQAAQDSETHAPGRIEDSVPALGIWTAGFIPQRGPLCNGLNPAGRFDRGRPGKGNLPCLFIFSEKPSL